MQNEIILIIENDVFLGDAMLRRLQDEPYQAQLVRDGLQGIDMIKKVRPNLVVLDANLPKMNGAEILAAKFNDPEIAAIPVIILTESDDSEEINKMLALGAKDYLIKREFNQQSLVNKVKQQLEQTVTLSTEGKKDDKKKSIDTERDRPSPLLIGKKVMWVEDDAFLSEIIARKLATQGCLLVHAADGQQALASAEKEHPNVVLLDILLPGMDGFQILTQMKANPATKDIPVILLSNLSQKSDIEKGEKLGAERFLIKAVVSLDEIVNEIEGVIRKFDGKKGATAK